MFQEGQTALHQAASAGHDETVAALILGGCDIGIQDFVSIYTTLHIYNNIYQYLCCRLGPSLEIHLIQSLYLPCHCPAITTPAHYHHPHHLPIVPDIN